MESALFSVLFLFPLVRENAAPKKWHFWKSGLYRAKTPIIWLKPVKSWGENANAILQQHWLTLIYWQVVWNSKSMSIHSGKKIIRITEILLKQQNGGQETKNMTLGVKNHFQINLIWQKFLPIKS